MLDMGVLCQRHVHAGSDEKGVKSPDETHVSSRSCLNVGRMNLMVIQ